jgi:hypothetical protein
MQLRLIGLGVSAVLALSAGAVLMPHPRDVGCRTAYFDARHVCSSLSHSAILARGLARRATTAALTETSSLGDALFSSPLVPVDFAPARKIGRWWMEQTGEIVMARFTLHH